MAHICRTFREKRALVLQLTKDSRKNCDTLLSWKYMIKSGMPWTAFVRKKKSWPTNVGCPNIGFAARQSRRNFYFFPVVQEIKAYSICPQYGVKLINKVLKYPRAHILGRGYSKRTPWNRRWWINFAPEDSTVCFHDIKRQCNFFHRKDRTDVSFQIIEFLCLRLICTEF